MSGYKPLTNAPTTADELIHYAKVRLGDGVITINVSDEQTGLCLREALDLFNDWHMDAVMELYMAVKITMDNVRTNSVVVPDYVTEVIQALNFNGLPSFGANDLLWLPGSLGLPTTGWLGGGVAGGFGNVATGGGPFNFTDAILLWQIEESRANFQSILFPQTAIRYNALTHEVFFDSGSWQNSDSSFGGIGTGGRLQAGNYAMLDVRASLERMGRAEMWNCDWLKRYVVALIGMQWGDNLSKFANQTLYGGTAQLNGPGILDRYTKLRDDLRVELYARWTKQPSMYTG